MQPGLFGPVTGKQWGVLEAQIQPRLPSRRGVAMLIDTIRVNITNIIIPSRHNMLTLEELHPSTLGRHW
jgi:hypothetical protein